MIQYGLVFALGFFAAALLALLISPILHRRVVVLTERRMRDTIALTDSEVRAEKDAARARYAGENRRLSVMLAEERRRRETTAGEHARLKDEFAKARRQLRELDGRIGELVDAGARISAELGQEQEHGASMENDVTEARHDGEAKARRIDTLVTQLGNLSARIEEMRIEIATRDTRIETMRSQIDSLRTDRQRLRDDLRRTETEAHPQTEREGETQERPDEQVDRPRSLDGRLASRIAELSDREAALERRQNDDRRSPATATTDQMDESREEISAAVDLSPEKPSDIERTETIEQTLMRAERAVGDLMGGRSERTMDRTATGAAIGHRVERLRKRHAALVDALGRERQGEDDQQLREEIAEIAAMMVDLTARREGAASPIHGILTRPDAQDATTHPSLAEHMRRRIAERSEEEG
ncbi:hypothetical protein [Pararhizobium mangrovi]|uniref:Uncharacterized protein n=1 Tax=Pararhizobium mangrovi TaxID=2590452 RepID=A0A506UHJ1_9HYPH|nr:hypothetical protein [Pararhizobium mangrovi]TPW32787.1 hypothetical protein FJU11_00745 [Pararhizobium mangrovi]